MTRAQGIPAGLAVGGVDVSKMRLEAGDSVIMISDGVASLEEDGWVKEALAAYDGNDPKSLAAALMDASGKREGATDDRTAAFVDRKMAQNLPA